MTIKTLISNNLVEFSKKSKILDKKEEYYHIENWRNKRNSESLKVILNSYLRLAVSFAKKYKSYGLPLDDLIHEGVLGIMHALEKFDISKGFRLSTYASWWIKQSVSRYVSSHRNTVRVPSHAVSLTYKITNMMKEYEKEFGTRPTNEEIASVLGVSETMVRAGIDAMRLNNILSIDMPIGDPDSSRTLKDTIEDVDAVSIEDILDNQKIRSKIIQSLSRLSKREEQVLRLRFGISEVSDPSQFEISN